MPNLPSGKDSKPKNWPKRYFRVRFPLRHGCPAGQLPPTKQAVRLDPTIDP
jgi:hypothetical protein